MIDLSGRVALVTGGSRGIGAATARMLAAAGADVAIQFLSRTDRAEAVAESIREAGSRCVLLPGPIVERDAVAEMVGATTRALGGLDILINNAGIWNPGPAGQTSDEVWDEMMAVNLRSGFLFVECALPSLRDREGRHPEASIVFVSSTAGQRGEAGHSHYAATKGAQISQTKSLATELAPVVRVNAVAPGWVDTELNDEVFKQSDRIESIRRGIPMGRIPPPEDIAGPILFLVSELARHVTGEVLNVNGGAVLVG